MEFEVENIIITTDQAPPPRHFAKLPKAPESGPAALNIRPACIYPLHHEPNPGPRAGVVDLGKAGKAVLLIHPEAHILQRSEIGYCATWRHLKFIVSINHHSDGCHWLHASVSRKDRKMPKYQDQQRLHEMCIGLDRWAVQIFPEAWNHVDVVGPLGMQVLHLWHRLEGRIYPDMRWNV